MSSLIKLYALGIQTDSRTSIIVYNTNNKYDKQCKECIKEGTVPSLFSYYGPGVCTKYLWDTPAKKVKYNAICDYGHECILKKV